MTNTHSFIFTIASLALLIGFIALWGIIPAIWKDLCIVALFPGIAIYLLERN